MNLPRKSLASERIGTINTNNSGSTMKVIAYHHTDSIVVQFDQGNTVHTTWKNFIKGQVRNPFDRTVYGVGYFGQGPYVPYDSVTKKDTPVYKTWSSMLQRCYSERSQKKDPWYIGCTVCAEWHNFQNFAKWYEDNYYTIEGETISLDKDIKVKGNKVYAPSNCIFVPLRINSLFVNQVKAESPLPVGVYFDKDKDRYRIVRVGSRPASCFDSVEEAATVYRKNKKEYITEIAEKYKGVIPEELYQLLLSYEVGK